jgi:hypothetical protein
MKARSITQDTTLSTCGPDATFVEILQATDLDDLSIERRKYIAELVTEEAIRAVDASRWDLAGELVTHGLRLRPRDPHLRALRDQIGCLGVVQAAWKQR